MLLIILHIYLWNEWWNILIRIKQDESWEGMEWVIPEDMGSDGVGVARDPGRDIPAWEELLKVYVLHLYVHSIWARIVRNVSHCLCLGLISLSQTRTKKEAFTAEARPEQAAFGLDAERTSVWDGTNWRRLG